MKFIKRIKAIFEMVKLLFELVFDQDGNIRQEVRDILKPRNYGIGELSIEEALKIQKERERKYQKALKNPLYKEIKSGFDSEDSTKVNKINEYYQNFKTLKKEIANE